MGCIPAKHVVEIFLKEIGQKRTRGYTENGDFEIGVIETLQNHDMKNRIPMLADIIRSR